MPTSKDISSYPLELYSIVERVLTDRHEITISLSSRSEALKLRFQTYGLRAALRNAADHPLCNEAAKLSTKLNGTELVICHIESLVPEGLKKAASFN